MPYALHSGEAMDEGMRRILKQQIEQALAELADTSLDQAATVHQVRKRCKKIRGVLRLFRHGLGKKTYAKENAWYRDAARRIADLRDTQAMLETCNALTQHSNAPGDHQAIQPICRRLQMRQRQLLQDTQQVDQLLLDFASALAAGHHRVSTLRLKGDHYQSALTGMGTTYDQARNAMRAAFAKPSPEAFHQWRKWVKYHGYHLRILQQAWPPVVKARRKEADKLGETLGDHHNLFVLQEWVQQEQMLSAQPAALSNLDRLITAWSTQLEQESKPLGRRLFAEKTKAFTRRFDAYCKAWMKSKES